MLFGVALLVISMLLCCLYQIDSKLIREQGHKLHTGPITPNSYKCHYRGATTSD